MEISSTTSRGDRQPWTRGRNYKIGFEKGKTKRKNLNENSNGYLGQPRGKLSRVVCSNHAVPSFKVIGNEVLVPQIVLESGQGSAFTCLALEKHERSLIFF